MLDFILSLFLFPQNPMASKYDQVVDSLKFIAQSHPATTQLIDIGQSDAGQPIYALKIGNGPVANLIVATHHGNEYGSTAVAVGVADSLAQDPLKNRTVYVIPVLNISGYNAGRREETMGGRTYDPNRDYPGPCGTSGPHKLKSTKALADFIAQKNIVSSATLHTYFPGVLYPWGISTRDLVTPQESTFINLSNMAAVESKYQVGNSTELLYPADGAFEDYAYWKHGIWSLLFEMGFSHNPNQDAVKELVRVNVPGLRRFLEQSPELVADQHEFTGKCDTLRLQQRIHLE